jgi:serine/threonine protein kinase/tetratricopeptide (TPR) repeat protein
MGTVYLARDTRLGRNVAIKLLNVEEVATEEQRLRFLREARAAAAVRHQNIATIYEVDETADLMPFIVMEYCEGETLADRIRRRPLDAEELVRVARQIASAVAAAHSQGIVHRDLKTPNIIIEPSGLVKILDFGLARRTGPATPGSFQSTGNHFFGTLHFLSPEQARGEQADERSDLFSIGVVFYQLATGRLPFEGEPPLMVLEKIRDGEPQPFVPLDPNLPPSIIKIIGRLLQKKPADRYQSAADLARDIEAIDSQTQRISFTQRSLLGRTRPRPPRARLAILLVALAVVIGAMFFVRGTAVAPPEPAKPVPPPPIRSMAVLPLNNLANNTRDEFLSVGLADALVTKLQQIPSLQVRPTSAILEFRDRKIDAREASRKLQVDGVLEGHFLAAGDLVRVNLQLTDGRTGYNVWADSIDGKRGDLLKLIDDVSSRTVTALNERLGVQESPQPASAPRSTNPKAYEEYLKARAAGGSLVPREYQAQIASLRRAIQLDPNFAAAYADLALAISIGHARSLTTEPDALQKAERYARQAVRLDPYLPQAHLALGRVFVRFPDRYRESVREILSALRLNANDAQALHALITYFISYGEQQKAQCILDRLMRLEPDSNESKTRGYYYINAVDPEGALRTASFALDSNETELAGHDIRALAFILLGSLQEAGAEQQLAAQLVPNHYIGKSLKAMIAAESGDTELAEAALRSFEGDARKNHWAAIRAAQTYARLGNRDKALEWTTRAQALGHHSWYALVKHPWMQPLQGDPEFQAILSKIKSDLDDVRDDVIGVHQLICP